MRKGISLLRKGTFFLKSTFSEKSTFIWEVPHPFVRSKFYMAYSITGVGDIRLVHVSRRSVKPFGPDGATNIPSDRQTKGFKILIRMRKDCTSTVHFH